MPITSSATNHVRAPRSDAPMTPYIPKLGPSPSTTTPRKSSGADTQQALAVAAEGKRALKDAVQHRETAREQLTEAARIAAERAHDAHYGTIT